jgi:hypothetical protein
MRMAFPRWFPVLLTALTLAPAGAVAQKGPALPDVLRLAGDYLVQYSQKLGAVAAEEEYAQSDSSSGQMGVPKRVDSEYVFAGEGGGGLLGFRDIYAIDNKPVRQRDDRLLGLFKNPTASSIQQAKELSESTVQYYLSVNLHALDQPALALEFLRKENQSRSTFKLESVKTMNGAQVAIVSFKEQSTPRVLPTSTGDAAIGKFWIDTATGAVRQSELGLANKTINIHVSVKYALESKLDLWLPVEMYQQVSSTAGGSGAASGDMVGGAGYSAHQSLEGRANYSKFRQVPVDLSKLK